MTQKAYTILNLLMFKCELPGCDDAKGIHYIEFAHV
jgi:hypothetical protein